MRTLLPSPTRPTPTRAGGTSCPAQRRQIVRERVSMRRILGITLAAATATTVGLGLGATTAQAAEGSVLYAGAAGAIKDSYLVGFKDNTMSAASVSDQVADKAAQYGSKVQYTYKSALRGFAGTMSADAARKLAA